MNILGVENGLSGNCRCKGPEAGSCLALVEEEHRIQVLSLVRERGEKVVTSVRPQEALWLLLRAKLGSLWRALSREMT